MAAKIKEKKYKKRSYDLKYTRLKDNKVIDVTKKEEGRDKSTTQKKLK